MEEIAGTNNGSVAKPECEQEDKKTRFVTKRQDYINWDDYFMSVACLSAQRSKDPITQVGACIVNEDRKIVGIGYNGMPIGCSDDELPWNKEADDPLNTKYFYVCHAELNSIMNSISRDLKGCSLYVTLFPCNECAKLIIQSGIKSIIYLREKVGKIEMEASKRMFKMAGITFTQFKSNIEKICIDFSSSDNVKCTVNRVNKSSFKSSVSTLAVEVTDTCVIE